MRDIAYRKAQENKKHKDKSKGVPPLWKFCKICNTERWFTINHALKHSECIVCGSRVAWKND